MNFQKKNIKHHKNSRKSSLETRYAQRKYSRKKKGSSWIVKFIAYTLWFFLVCSIILSIVLYQKYLVWLPSVKELENLEIAEWSTIYDREGGELYNIYKEKRTYIQYEDINSNMINALVAWEDKRYWENPWVDLIWIIRAVVYRAIWKTTKLEGTSTLTQQLIRNTIIANERKIERKIKEIYLSYKLSKELSKEKILELYLNKISFWHNSYGIEQAAKTFFDKSAKELGILESSIIASLPKGPTYYSPYNHPDRVLWFPYVYEIEDEETQENITKIITTKDKILNKEILNEFTSFIQNLKSTPLELTNRILICNLKKEYFKNDINIDNDLCSVVEYSKLLSFLNGIKIAKDEQFIEYQTGRKDFILWRMLEDWYIGFEDYKSSVINSIAIKFSSTREEINAPHFVFFVKEYLENKYGKEIVESGGLKIHTTLDPELQKKAEEIVLKQAESNEINFNATNAALISINNENWDILSMVGWKDYFDKENKWNVNIITSKLQPWSTFKPFVYSMWIYNNTIGTKTPIYDVETEFTSEYTTANFDGKFMGKMNLSTALNNSRNIPAIKMFYLAWWEKNIISFMKKIWVNSLKNHNQYGAPLALWTLEMTPLELATAYSVFANEWTKKEISPILKIVDAKWNIIEEKKDIKGEEVISEAQTYITNSILTDTWARPEFWNAYLTIPGRKLAAKTWTSTKQEKKNGKKIISPSNLWTIGYTPQITTVAWAWNNDGSQLNDRWNGLEWAGPIMRDFMEFAHKWRKVKNWKKPSSVKEINTSEISWLLPSPENTNGSFLIKSLFVNTPENYDSSFKTLTVDLLCNGLITDETPEAAKKSVNLVEFHSLSQQNSKWENPVQAWANATWEKDLENLWELYYSSREKYGNIPNLVTSINTNSCERTLTAEPNIIIKSKIEDQETFTPWENYIELAYRSDSPIKQLDILIDDILIQEIPLKNRLEWAYIVTFYITKDFANREATLQLRVVDENYYSANEQKQIIIKEKDRTPPEIIVENPADLDIMIYNDIHFNLKAEIKDRSNIRTINIRLNDKPIQIGLTKRKISVPINLEKDIPVWLHVLQIEAIDKDFNKSVKNIDLEVLAR